MQELLILDKCNGINALLPPEILLPSQQSPQYVASLVNMDITDDGLLMRRMGYSTILNGNVSGVITAGDYLYFIVDRVIASLRSGVITPVKQVGFQNLQLVKIGGGVYYAYPAERGYIEGTNAITFEGDYGFAQCLHGGRVFHVSEDKLIFTDPMAYNSAKAGTNYIRIGPGLMSARAISKGVVAFSRDSVYMLLGNSPADYEFTKLISEFVIIGTEIEVTNAMIKGEVVSGTSVFFTTQSGVWVVTPSGELLKLTNGTMALPCNSADGLAWYCHGYYNVTVLGG